LIQTGLIGLLGHIELIVRSPGATDKLSICQMRSAGRCGRAIRAENNSAIRTPDKPGPGLPEKMTREPAAASLVGSRIGDYQVLSLLGEGGQAKVYRARDLNLGRDVAIKILPTELSEQQSLLTRLEREAHLASALNHPNIITIYSIDRVRSTLCIAMELVDGRTLNEVRRDGPMPFSNGAELGVQMAT